MAVERGKLIVRDKGGKRSVLVQLGDKPAMNIVQGQVSQSLIDRLEAFNGQEVELERVGGQPTRVREPGGTFVASGLSMDQRKPGRLPSQRDLQRPRLPLPHNSEPHRIQGDFRNPYNFVPAPPRNTTHVDLGDHAPIAQDTFAAERYTGRIRVRMTVETPLLLPDPAGCDDPSNGHKTYPLRVDASGRPSIPASSVRGMLRSAYEAVTNSRFGVFAKSQHEDRLAFRMDAREGLKLVPARVENGQIRLLTGTSSVQPDGKSDGVMYAAWLRRYRDGKDARDARCYRDRSRPQHGDKVVCHLELIQHHRWDSNRKQLVPDFRYWSVSTIARTDEELGVAADAVRTGPPRDTQGTHQPCGGAMRRVDGWVCVTNANINRKHDERVFFVDSDFAPPGPFDITEAHRAAWCELIRNYQGIHAEALRRRAAADQRPDTYLGPDPGQTAWSRHVYSGRAEELIDGTLCYARLNQSQTQVEALFPVSISRELYQVGPWGLLDPSLRPASSIEELSPADRAFGWVCSEPGPSPLTRGGQLAVRGLLRVGPVVCESTVEHSVEHFDGDGVPLAILATPKPQQGRFYVAKSRNGEAQDDALSKGDAGYSGSKGLRGRKFYPHHRGLPRDHWARPAEDRTQQGQGQPAHFQEYRRPAKAGEEQRDDQNRSILGWVKPGARFAFDIHVHNLSKVELGALVWLFELPPEHFFRLGGGKPLGFGSVRLAVDTYDVALGAKLKCRYESWCDDGRTPDSREDAIQAFRAALTAAYPQADGTAFDCVPFIQAFLKACRGYDDGLPIHYPRASEDGKPGPPMPEGESFKWFVANERSDARYALQGIVGDRGLRTLRDPQRSLSKQRPR